jgi:hypothetical protein
MHKFVLAVAGPADLWLSQEEKRLLPAALIASILQQEGPTRAVISVDYKKFVRLRSSFR